MCDAIQKRKSYMQRRSLVPPKKNQFVIRNFINRNSLDNKKKKKKLVDEVKQFCYIVSSSLRCFIVTKN